MGEQSGPVGSAINEGPKAVQAWAASVNAKGGLGCHPIRYLIADDGGDPSRNQALVQQMVEQDHVIAFVNMDAPLGGNASVNYITQHQIPVIGTETGSPWVYDSPMFFPQAPSGDLLTKSDIFGAGVVARLEHVSNLGIISCVEASICSSVTRLGPQYARAAGMQVVYNGTGSLAQPDYTSNCLDAQKAGAEILFLSLDANSIQRVVRSCQSVNYRPILASGSSAVNVSFATNSAFEGLSLGMEVLPWFVTSNPAIAEYQSVLHRYAPGVQVDPGSVVGWVSAKMFEAVTVGLTDPTTSQALLQGLYRLNGTDLGGLTIPLRFTPGQDAPLTFCYWSARIKGGQWTSPNNGLRTCL